MRRAQSSITSMLRTVPDQLFLADAISMPAAVPRYTPPHKKSFIETSRAQTNAKRRPSWIRPRTVDFAPSWATNARYLGRHSCFCKLNANIAHGARLLQHCMRRQQNRRQISPTPLRAAITKLTTNLARRTHACIHTCIPSACTA